MVVVAGGGGYGAAAGWWWWYADTTSCQQTTGKWMPEKAITMINVLPPSSPVAPSALSPFPLTHSDRHECSSHTMPPPLSSLHTPYTISPSPPPHEPVTNVCGKAARYHARSLARHRPIHLHVRRGDRIQIYLSLRVYEILMVGDWGRRGGVEGVGFRDRSEGLAGEGGGSR